MILSNAKNIIVNGVVDPDIFVNSVQVWPSLGALQFYRVYIKWSPSKSENLTFQGLGWNGNPGTLTTSMLLDAQKSNNGYQYTDMTSAEQDGICNTSAGTNIWCYAIALDIDSSAFSNFQWRTQQYYALTGTVEIKVDAYYENGIVEKARKTVTQAANTTFTISAGEFDT
jgi:hypothetical protein